MAVLPVKGLGRNGVFKDMAPYNLPLTAWSNGRNVRFESGRVRRSPAFRTINTSFTVDPAFAFGVRPSSGNDFFVYTDDNGNMYVLLPTGHFDRTPVSFTPSSSSAIFTGTVLDDTAYVNRSTDVPYALPRAATEFAPLTNFGWPANDRCGVIRSFRDHLIFLDNTIGGVERPTTVRWSDNVIGSGAPPSDYDTASTTNNAGLNPLPDMKGRILDGQSLKDIFLIYSNSEVWRMRPTTSSFVFTFDKLFSDEGIIATDCVVQSEGLHYVFGEHDIYVTDGITKKSILEDADGNSSNRDYIYSVMNKSKKQNFRVIRNPILDEILFCYVSNSGDAAYQGGDYPNEAAVYSIKNKTWTFVDLPSIVGSAELIFTEDFQWDQVTTSWDQTGGTWNGASDSLRTSLFMVKRADSNASGLPADSVAYAYDVLGEGSVVTEPVDPNVMPPAFVERVGIDLDEVSAEIRQYKLVRSAYPQARVFDQATLNFTFGSSLYAWDNPTFDASLTFDPEVQTKIDMRRGGRYLTVRAQVDDAKDFWLSGLDLDIVYNGRRG